MAITINEQPNLLTPAFNENIFVAETDNTQPIFEYQLRVKSGPDTLGQFTYAKRVDNELCLFDAAKTIQNKVSYDATNYNAGTLGIYPALNTHIEYYIEFAELSGTTYSNVASGSPTNSNTITALNWSVDDLDSIGLDIINDYNIGSLPDSLLLTDMRGDYIRVKPTNKFELGFIQNKSSTAFDRLEIKTYSEVGGLLGTYRINNSYKNTTTTSEQFLSCHVGPATLNSQTYTSGLSPITDNVYYYEVYTINSVGDRTSEIIKFQVDRSCYKYESCRIVWLNKYGRLDAFNFNFLSNDFVKVEKKTFSKIQGVLSGGSFTRSRLESGKTTYYNQNVKSKKIRTDYISDIEAQWLQGLVESSICWIDLNGLLIACNITDTEYSPNIIDQNGFKPIEFNVEFSVPNYRQTL